MNKRLLPCGLLVLALTIWHASSPALAADLLPLPMAPSAEAVGLSSERLAGIEQATARHIQMGTLPGAVMLVARKGQIAWFRSMGYQMREAGEPMRPDTIFRIYSMTKPVVTVAALTLVDAGRLSLGDPVSRYLPELSGMQVGHERTDYAGRSVLDLLPAESEMTILDLMRHTSGITYGESGRSLIHQAFRNARLFERNCSNQEQIRRLAALPLRFNPGSRWEYGASTEVLGRVLEVVEGMSLGEVLHKRVFAPLGMRDSAFHVPPEKLDRAAQPAPKPGGMPMTSRFDVARKPAFESAGTGLLSTMHDYLRFTAMLANGGELEGLRLLRRETVALMTRDHLGNLPGHNGPYGFGLGVEVRRVPDKPGRGGLAGEYGWTGAAGTLFFVDPKRELIGIYLAQVNHEDRSVFRDEFRHLVYSAVIN